MKRSLLLALLTLGWAASARAEWTVNAGYHNPVVSTYGLNLLHFGSEWGFEAGLGWIDLDSTADKKADDDGKATKSGGKNTTSLHLAGDLDLKYFLTSGKLRPYLQGGFGLGIGASTGDDSGVDAGTGGGFLGAGLLVGSPAFYAYASYDIDGSKDTFWQAGLGISL